MKNAVSIFCVSLLSFCGLKAVAQGTVAGCLVAGAQRVYIVDGGGSVYDPRYFTDLSANYCSWTPSTGTTCNICSTALNGGGNCPGHNYQAQGVEGVFTMLPCPIDRSILPLILSILAFGVFAIRTGNFLAV